MAGNSTTPGSKRTVLITGCSDGGLGAALAVAFHNAGLHVYATARNPLKMKSLSALGIETLTLDILSDSSIAECVSKLSSLDILVNNAGAGYTMPVSDLSIVKAKELFDLNVWSYIAVTQAFLPLLLKSKGIIVNQTSLASVTTVPFQSAYNASKAAIATFSDSQRLELAPFGIKVVDLKTGMVESNFWNNVKDAGETSLPKDSIYEPARKEVETTLRGTAFAGKGEPPELWAGRVVQDLLQSKPPPVIWRGTNAGIVRIGTMLPFGFLDGTTKQLTGLDVVEKIIKK
jgi:1-acylglycerone phosphate reductase